MNRQERYASEFIASSRAWTNTYGKRKTDSEAVDWIVKALSSATSPIGRPMYPNEVACLLCTTKWIDCGSPTLIADPKYAAAMMCTRITETFKEELIIPWKSFRIDVPEGLLDHDENRYECITVASFELGPKHAFPRAHLLLQGTQCEDLITEVSFAPDLGTLLFDVLDPIVTTESGEEANIASMPGAEQSRIKAMRMAMRLVVGLLYTMQYTQHFKRLPRSLNDSRSSLRNGPPRHRTIYFGRPISYDARPAVREYVARGERRGPASVQTLVRGHYKRQVVGVSRSGRRVIWVEPYWRGPEDAPILARPYQIGGAVIPSKPTGDH